MLLMDFSKPISSRLRLQLGILCLVAVVESSRQRYDYPSTWNDTSRPVLLGVAHQQPVVFYDRQIYIHALNVSSSIQGWQLLRNYTYVNYTFMKMANKQHSVIHLNKDRWEIVTTKIFPHQDPSNGYFATTARYTVPSSDDIAVLSRLSESGYLVYVHANRSSDTLYINVFKAKTGAVVGIWHDTSFNATLPHVEGRAVPRISIAPGGNFVIYVVNDVNPTIRTLIYGPSNPWFHREQDVPATMPGLILSDNDDNCLDDYGEYLLHNASVYWSADMGFHYRRQWPITPYLHPHIMRPSILIAYSASSGCVTQYTYDAFRDLSQDGPAQCPDGPPALIGFQHDDDNVYLALSDSVLRVSRDVAFNMSAGGLYSTPATTSSTSLSTSATTSMPTTVTATNSPTIVTAPTSTSTILIVIGTSLAVLVTFIIVVLYRYTQRRTAQQAMLVKSYLNDESEDDEPLLPSSGKADPSAHTPQIELKHRVSSQAYPCDTLEMSQWEMVNASIAKGETVAYGAILALEQAVNRLDHHRQSLLTHAAVHAQADTVAMLTLQCKLSTLTALDNKGYAPIHWACLVGSMDCIKAMIRAKAGYVDLLLLTTEQEQNLLHLAVAEGHAKMLLLLLECGSRRLDSVLLNCDANNETPLELAHRLQHDDCAAVLQGWLDKLLQREPYNDLKRRLRKRWTTQMTRAVFAQIE